MAAPVVWGPLGVTLQPGESCVVREASGLVITEAAVCSPPIQIVSFLPTVGTVNNALEVCLFDGVQDVDRVAPDSVAVKPFGVRAEIIPSGGEDEGLLAQEPEVVGDVARDTSEVGFETLDVE